MAIVLLLNAHTDDSEYGCGGTIAKLVEEGNEVHYVAFSGSEESVPEGLPKDILRHEVMESTMLLGIAPENVKVLNFQVRNFPRDRQAILDEMIDLKSETKPDIILAPSIHDIHQDHRVVAEEALRAFKNSTIWHFEIPYKNIVFNPNLYIKLDQIHLDKKIEAVNRYKSQSFRGNSAVRGSFFTQKYVEANARFRGQQIEEEFAESFEIIREVIRGHICSDIIP